jgi:hypothetical protein
MQRLCSICDLPIIPGLNRTHPLQNTRDHIVPKKLGGPDTPENIAPAHNCCNHAKADKLLDEETKAVCRERVMEIFTGPPELFDGMPLVGQRNAIAAALWMIHQHYENIEKDTATQTRKIRKYTSWMSLMTLAAYERMENG